MEMAKTTMDGTEQTLFESTELGEYNGQVFFDKMQAGDTITLRVFLKDEEDATYKLRDSKAFNGVQTASAIGFLSVIGKVGYKVTAQQSAGTYRQVTHQWFKR